MENELVSIIIPVYNVASYISECLKSIESQTYSNLEILVIDDGSSDKTADIVRYFASKDKRIRLISQSNQGVSSARNHGLDLMSGKYVAFVDGDDWIEEGYIEKMYKKMSETDSDIVKSGCRFINTDTGKTRLYRSLDKLLIGVKAIEYYLCGRMISSSMCGGLYRSDLFHNNVRFDSHVKIGEDGQMTLLLLSKAKKVALIPDILYNIRVREGSASRSNILISDECQVLDWIQLPPSINDDFRNAYRLRVATSLLIKNSFMVTRSQYADLREQLNYDNLNITSSRSLLANRWKLFSTIGKSKYGVFYIAKLLKFIGLKPTL